MIPFLLFFILPFGCNSNERSPEEKKIIRLDKLEQLPQRKTASREDIIPVAVAAILSPTGNIESYSPLLRYMENTLGKQVVLVQRKTYGEINELLSQGSVDLAFICTGAYIEGLKDDIMSILVVPRINGKLTYRSFIIVQRSAEVNKFEDLRGKVFAFTDPMSNTGYFSPLSLLGTIDETPSSFFSRVIFTYSHDRSIQAVAEGMADGASVDNLVLEHARARNSGLDDKVRVIWESEEFGIPPVVVPRQLPSHRREILEKMFLDIHNHQTGREALRELGVDMFVKPDLSLYDSW